MTAERTPGANSPITHAPQHAPSCHAGPAASNDGARWAVVIDAGSTGSRLAAYKFVDAADPSTPVDIQSFDLDLVDFSSVKPGLSSYAGKPEEAAASLAPLIEKALAGGLGGRCCAGAAEHACCGARSSRFTACSDSPAPSLSALAVIPADQQAATPLLLGATAGLRLLPGTQADEILAAARTYIKEKTPFKVGGLDRGWLGGCLSVACARVATGPCFTLRCHAVPASLPLPCHTTAGGPRCAHHLWRRGGDVRLAAGV